jgi:hypothetical protein
VTEFYDNYLDSYTNDDDEAPPMPPVPVQQPDRVAQWARNNADPRNNNDSPRRAPSSASRPPPSTYAPSSYGGGGTIRRKLTRRNTSRGQSRAQSSYGQYEEEEEGYASGDYDDMIYELVKIRVKVGAMFCSVNMEWIDADRIFVSLLLLASLPRRCTWYGSHTRDLVRRVRGQGDCQVWQATGRHATQVQR